MFKITKIRPRTLIFSFKTNFIQSLPRSIYTVEQLSVDQYVRERKIIQMNLQTSSIQSRKSSFEWNIKQKNIKSFSLLNDFTQLLHIIDNTPNDMALVEMALDKFKNVQVENLRKNTLGSLTMKMCYHFGRDDVAQRIYNDPYLRDIFLRGKQTNLIFFDLLYKQKRYTELLEYFEDFKNRLAAKQQIIIRSIYVLVFATCYAQNTEKSFAYAQQLHEQFSDAHITMEHLVFLSALALKQNAPHIADQLCSVYWPAAHESIASIRLLALLQMRKFTDFLQILRSIMLVFDNNQVPKNEVISDEVIKEADAVFKSDCEDERLRADFQQIKGNLIAHGYIVNKSLQKMIFEPIKMTNMTRHQKSRLYLQAEFDTTNLLN